MLTWLPAVVKLAATLCMKETTMDLTLGLSGDRLAALVGVVVCAIILAFMLYRHWNLISCPSCR